MADQKPCLAALCCRRLCCESICRPPSWSSQLGCCDAVQGARTRALPDCGCSKRGQLHRYINIVQLGPTSALPRYAGQAGNGAAATATSGGPRLLGCAVCQTVKLASCSVQLLLLVRLDHAVALGVGHAQQRKALLELQGRVGGTGRGGQGSGHSVLSGSMVSYGAASGRRG